MKTLHYKFVSALSLIALLFVATGCQNQSEKVELNRFKDTVKKQEQNKTIVRDFFAAIDKQDFDKLNALLSENFTLTAAGLEKPWTKDDVFKDIKKYYTAFPDWHHEIESMIAEGDKVAVKLNQNGTQTAQFDEIVATGAKVIKPAFHLVTIVDGKIKEWWGLEDDLGLMLQLGMVLKPNEIKK